MCYYEHHCARLKIAACGVYQYVANSTLFSRPFGTKQLGDAQKMQRCKEDLKLEHDERDETFHRRISPLSMSILFAV